MSLVALIPAYEAAATIAGVVAGTREFVEDVLVVDDGSSDGTARAAEGAGAKVIRFSSNRGKGAALRAGFDHAVRAGIEGVVTLDADGQHDPGQIPKIVSRWRESGAWLVIGTRLHLEGDMLPIRRFGNRFSRRAVSFFAGVQVPDPQTGFRLYDARLLRALTLRGDRYELESEVIVKAARAGFPIESVEIGLLQGEGSATSHYRAWIDTARICVAVVRSRLLG